MCTLATRTAPPKPVSGTCRWLEPMKDGLGCLEINGTAYTVMEIKNGFLLRKEDGTEYGISIEEQPWVCDCGDYTFRRANVDPKGCKHVAALRAALDHIPLPVCPVCDRPHKHNPCEVCLHITRTLG